LPLPAFTAGWLRGRLRGLLPVAISEAESTPAGSLRSARRAAVLVALAPAPRGFVLLTRRSRLLRTHSGQVSFPGGRPDPSDPSLVETALREAQEEIGLERDQVELLGRLADQHTLTSNFLITPFVGLLAPQARWQAAPAEVDAIFGLPLSLLLDPGAPRRIETGLRRGSWSWPHPDHDIWGATAAILLRLARQLRRPASGVES